MAQGPGFFKRLGQAIRHIVAPVGPTPAPPKPTPVRDRISPSGWTPPKATPVRDRTSPSGWRPGTFPPEIYPEGPPPSSILLPEPVFEPLTKDETFAKVLDNAGYADDAFAARLVWAGWFDVDMTPDQRHNAREMFFDYADIYEYDFDWKVWKDWYENA